MSDAVRFTFTYSPQRYADGVRADVVRLKAEGFELIKLKNLWADEQYKGINSQWRRPETGLRFEVQFHTQESLEAKELTHEAYERIRGQRHARRTRGAREPSSARQRFPRHPGDITDESRIIRRKRMAEKITYYAMVDEFTSRDNPRTVLRRVRNDEGTTDEVFSRDLSWEFSPLMYSSRARRPGKRLRPD